MSRRMFPLLFALALSSWLLAGTAPACPFCSAVSQTFSEEITSMDASVIARLVEPPAPAKAGDVGRVGEEVAKAKFEIEHVLKGQELLGDQRTIEALYFGEGKTGRSFLILAADPANLMWSTPLLLSDRARRYMTQIVKLPTEGAARLEFFQNHLEDADEMLARDAYDEFAKAPYDAVKTLKEKMQHDRLAAWIKDPDIPASRRRLYLTMLGVCGSEKDLPLLETMLKSDDRKSKAGLDAMIACYLTLYGADGMPLIEDLFLKNKEAEYADTYAAIMALRFHGTETDVIPRERILGGLRHMLDRPQLADLVIPDLARWEDWSQMERLVKLFKDADEKSSWVRVPVINYLRACPLPQAKDFIKELEKVDPAAVKRANTFFPFGAGGPAGNKTSANDGSESDPVAAVAEPDVSPASPLPAESGEVAAALTDDNTDDGNRADSVTNDSAATDSAATDSAATDSAATDSAATDSATADSATADSATTSGPTTRNSSRRAAVRPAPGAAASPNLFAMVGVPWVAGAVLMLVLWGILAGGNGSASS